MSEFDFYQGHLDAVSRSFALCIPQLTPPFRDHVALAYLLLRVLDTVEDATFDEKQVQARAFDQFRTFLRARPQPEEVLRFCAAFPQGITAGERGLLADAHVFFDDLHDLSPSARAHIVECVDRMAEGMTLYARRPAPLRLLDLEDVVRYCCIVAGTVGELLTRLYVAGPERRATPGPRLLHAYQFGLFLQKVNILKDQEEDEAAQRYFVPDRDELLCSLRADAAGALAYLCSLPLERGYRTFCAWSLMLGADSLAQQAGPRASRRAQTMELLARTAAIAQDDGALQRLFAELMPRLPDVPRRAVVPKGEAEERAFRRLMATLEDGELRALGAQYG